MWIVVIVQVRPYRSCPSDHKIKALFTQPRPLADTEICAEFFRLDRCSPENGVTVEAARAFRAFKSRGPPAVTTSRILNGNEGGRVSDPPSCSQSTEIALRTLAPTTRSSRPHSGFTIGGARQRLTGDDAKSDVSQSQQIIKQLRLELEQVLKILRR